MTPTPEPPTTGLNPHDPQYSGWRVDPDSARNFRREIEREERELLRENQRDHEDLRARVAKLEHDAEEQKPVIKAASKMVMASNMVKAAIVILAVLLSVLTGAIQVFDRWLQR